MKIELGLNTLKIMPENQVEEAYLANTFDLKEKGAAISLVRRDESSITGKLKTFYLEGKAK